MTSIAPGGTPASSRLFGTIETPGDLRLPLNGSQVSLAASITFIFVFTCLSFHFIDYNLIPVASSQP